MKKFFQDNGYLLLAILVVAVIGGIIANMLTKQVAVDPVTGEPLANGAVFKGKLSLKSDNSTVK